MSLPSEQATQRVMESFAKNKERMYELDFLRAIAIIAVLIIHSVTRYALSANEKLIGGFASLMLRPCIGIFLFLAGYLFVKNISKYKFFQKIKRVFIPYFIFSSFGIFYMLITKQIGLLQVPYFFTKNVLLGNVFGVYYFIFIILIVYSITYIFFNNLSKLDTLYITIFALFINFLHVGYATDLLNKIQIDQQAISFYSYRAIPVWIFFFLLGILFREYECIKYIKKNREIVRILWITIFGLYSLLYFLDFKHIEGYNSIIGTLFSISTIVFLLTFNYKNKFIQELSAKSYYIYLSHIFIVYIIYDFYVSHKLGQNYLILTSLSFILSLFIPLIIFYILHYFLKNKTKLLFGA